MFADTQNDSELLKGLLTDTFCQVCEAVLMFESQRVSHYEGKKHAQRVRIYLQTKKAERNKQSCESNSFQRDPEKFCELCNMVFSSPVVAKSHYKGKVHFKNTRKSSATSSLDGRTAGPAASPVTAVEDAVEPKAQDALQEHKEITDPSAQGVDLSDPDKYCKLCTASFNNPVMASEHYSGRKHQRNLARQEQHSKLGEQSEHANSLTCPLCHVTLSSVDTYQAHMKANKHNIKEKKTQEDLCQKKVYDSFQDELADYIQVQRSRGLGPKTGQGSETQDHRKAGSNVEESGECHVEPQVVSLQSRPPAPAFRTQPWRPPFHPHHNPAAFRGRFCVPNQWDQGYSSYPPPLIPGLTGRALRRGRSPESFSSSSSFSDSSSSGSSSTTSSSNEDSRDRTRRRKKRRDATKKKREDKDETDEDLQRRRREDGSAKKPTRQRGSSDEDQGKRWKVKKQRERVPKKRRREEEEREWNREAQVEMTKEDREAHGEGFKEEKTKHKKEKRKPKDREDNRTEEEKLWDETILGIF
ncbi:zinc finger matrin-type protein 1 isoform X1 [Tachysurus ichikawai]